MSITHLGNPAYVKSFEKAKYGHLITIENVELEAQLLYAQENLHFVSLIQIWAREISENKFKLTYQLKSFKQNQYLFVSIEVNSKEQILSLAPVWPVAEHFEREINELFGLEFNFHAVRNYLRREQISAPMRSFSKVTQSELLDAEDEKEFADGFSLALKDPMLSGHLKFHISAPNEKVDFIKIEHGMVYAGLEKSFESLKADQLPVFARRLHHFSSITHNLLLAKSIEDILAIKIPERAMAIRVILAELGRIGEHLYCLEQVCKEMNYNAPAEYCARGILQFRCLLGLYNKNSFNSLINLVGGISNDIPRGWAYSVDTTLDELESLTLSINKLFIQSQLFKERSNTAHISNEQILDFGIAGPNARASGVNYDIRKNRPYYFYNEIEFDVPVGTYGKVYDRVLVRIEEIFQSIKIVKQVLDNLPPGAITAPEALTSDLLNTVTDSEYYQLVAQGRKFGSQINGYTSLEGPNGELGLHISANNTALERVKFYSASMNAFHLAGELLKGEHYEDVAMVFSSLNISMTEVER